MRGSSDSKTSFWLVVCALFLALSVWAWSTRLPAEVKPLNRYTAIFAEGSERTFLADEVRSEGRCNILITEGKPILWICMDHFLLALGPAAPKVEPEPEVVPEADYEDVPADPNQSAELN